jgi:putative transposase
VRTIKRVSEIINQAKWQALSEMVEAYAKEKNYWIGILQQQKSLQHTKNHRKIRDAAVMQKYESPNGLQARMWKLALIDAAETMDKYWQSIYEKIKLDIYRNKNFDDKTRHYCFWLLKDYKKLLGILHGQCIEFKDMDEKKRKHAINFLQKKIKRYRKNYPRVKTRHSFALDENCYTCFKHKDTQYIKIMSLIKGKRLVVPLKGETAISGNIRIVLQDKFLTVHCTTSIEKSINVGQGKVIAIDFGYTEVLTDSEGSRYGNGFGKNLTEISDWLKNKMIKRNKLHALQKKYAASSDELKLKKAQKITKYNLGKRKFNAKLSRHKSTSLKIVNTAFNKMLAKTESNVVISEDLSHEFSFGKYKNMNRRLSSWLRNSLKERLSFKALVKGFDHKEVNAAYTSQTCVRCDFVDAANRLQHNRDKFKCQYCKGEGSSDVFAAINLKARYDDREITRYTPYREVKKILLNRFHRRLEAESLVTVSGRIPDTRINLSTGLGQSESEHQKTNSDSGYV